MVHQFAPPNPPWLPLPARLPLDGYLSYYLSDDLSGIAVRGVTLLHNNKSDPNLETGTYGLFSTCAQGMRASIVKRRYGLIFFMTRRDGRRVLTGYYRLGWYAPGRPNVSPPDYALAADVMHFVHPPVTMDELPRSVADVVARPFRIYKFIDSEISADLLNILNRRPDRSELYLRETDRLERFNRKHAGYRYVGWRREEPFSWSAAGEYLRPALPASHGPPMRASTTSPTDRWQCSDCREVLINKALLKRCPACKAMNTLRAMP